MGIRKYGSPAIKYYNSWRIQEAGAQGGLKIWFNTSSFSESNPEKLNLVLGFRSSWLWGFFRKRMWKRKLVISSTFQTIHSFSDICHLPTPFTPSPGQPLLHSLLLWIRAFSIYAYETVQLFSFVCLAYCTERNILQFCWCCCKQQDLLYFRLINKLICKIYKDACSLEEKLWQT